MNEKQLSQICLLILIFGGILFFFTYQNDFKETSIDSVKIDEKGIFFGKIDYVIKQTPSTLFVFNDGNTILAYYPKATTLTKNDFVTLYAQKQIYNGEEELYVYKVIKE